MVEYFWCLTHDRVEKGRVCRAANRLGPYSTEAAARGWKDRVEDRAESWKADDERWHGEDASTE